MIPTKDQWAAIEKELSGSYGRVELRCDGYQVVATVALIAPLRMGIAVYVNGWIKGKWFKGEAEEARKFHRPVKRYLYSAKKRDEAKKLAKRRYQTAETRKIYNDIATASFTTWTPYWTNAKAFARQLRKTCTEIEIVSIGYGTTVSEP